MEPLGLKNMIMAGMHFGHQASRWNPKMRNYIFKKRNLIHIIDLRKSVQGLIAAGMLLEKISARGGYVLMVGTKRQAKSVVREQATRCSQPYVAERWPGGLLTNYSTVLKRLDRLRELERWEETGEMNLHSKKMISTFRREQRKIRRNLGGVRDMDKQPGAVVVVDPGREHIAIREASRLHIPTIALADTDCDPDNIDIIVPGNDDSIGSIEIFLGWLADAVLRGVARRPSMMPSAGVEEFAQSADAPAEAAQPKPAAVSPRRPIPSAPPAPAPAPASAPAEADAPAPAQPESGEARA